VILSGPEIEIRVAAGDIVVDPYVAAHVGPNSIDLRLADDIRVYDGPLPMDWKEAGVGCGEDVFLDAHRENPTRRLEAQDGRIILFPGTLYLGRTVERIGSTRYVPLVEGRSSTGRLGISVHATAGVCDLGFLGTITLEITVVHPTAVYVGDRICQAMFLKVDGEPRLYKGRYQGQVDATPSRFWVGVGPRALTGKRKNERGEIEACLPADCDHSYVRLDKGSAVCAFCKTREKL